jgi:Uncharacterized conserved protein
MCGRAAQTLQTVQHAAQRLLCQGDNFSIVTTNISSSSCSMTHSNSNPSRNDIIAAPTMNDSCRAAPLTMTIRDNFNIAPGHDTIVFYASTTSSTTTNTSTRDITYSPLTWGLCPSNGTRNNPLPEGPSKHFSNLMFNARAETLYSKKTFSQLALRGQTCIWAVDGYFEWKEDQDNVLKKGGGKQPYFVKGKHGMPLYIPGLWHKVKTGKWRHRNGGATREKEEEEYIETFTIITTEACDALKWLHGRQPILLFDLELARKWLCSPSSIVLEEMVKHSQLMVGKECHGRDAVSNHEETSKTKKMDCPMEWYPVTKQMSKIGYDGQDCIAPVKIDKVASVKSFFTNASKKVHCKKHTLEEDYKEKGQDGVCKNVSPVKKPKGNNVAGGRGQGEIQKFFNDSSKEKYNTTTSISSSQSPGKRTKITPENRNNNVKKKGPIDAFFFKCN